MVGKYKVITLCGSTRFKNEFMETQKRLTLEGNIIISVGLFGHSGDVEVWAEGTKEMLDDMHLRKSDYIWSYSGNKTILYQGHATGSIPVSNGLSDRISRDLKKRGFKYVGAITIYSHLRREASPLGQACGIINDHDKECPCWQKIVNDYPTVNKRRDHEVK